MREERERERVEQIVDLGRSELAAAQRSTLVGLFDKSGGDDAHSEPNAGR